MPDKVVITGMGTVNPLGLSVKVSWNNAIEGMSGIAPITLFDTNDYLVNLAGEVKGFEPSQYMQAKEARRRDRYQQMASAAADEAIAQSGLEIAESQVGRVGVIVSSAIGGLKSIAENIDTLLSKGPRRVSPFVIPMLMANGAAGLIGIDTGIKGPAMSVASACASGIDGIGLAWMMLRSGMIDAALTGASESTITETGIAAFDRIGALSRRNDDYTTTPAPFDKNRDGLVMGEGAGILVLERESHAIGRSANILAELAGYASTADAFHITAPSTEGAGAAAAISQALATAQINPDEVDYISAHGTATQLNDASETKALKAALGQHAYDTAISSTKSMTGHMMGATGALETIFCVKAIRENTLPPTIHYETPDPVCDLDYVPNQAREKKVAVAISNAFGFGGHNSVLVVKEYR